MRIKLLDQFGQHGKDTSKHFFAFFNSLFWANSFGGQGIQACCTLGGGPAGIVEELGSSWLLSFPVAFSDVQRRQTGSIQLLANLNGLA